MAIIPLNGDAGCILNDVLVPGDPELIEGTGGADTIDCRDSPSRHDIYGYAGGDTLIGSNFDDFIAGGGNADTILGGNGDDAIDGGADDDVIYGESGDDIIFGGVGSAPASGVGCTLKAEFIALGSSYLTKGGSGDDIIHGGPGNDCIDAGSGEDFVYGEEGNDTLEGGNHSDVLDGGPGDDWIDGGWHTDRCIGGDGDTFISCESEEACEIDCGTPPVCGNGIKEQGEGCDGEDLGGAACGDVGCSGGDLNCSESCTLEISSCTGCPLCDNDSMCESGEDCNNCSNDCAGKSNGKPSGRYCCGDGTKQPAEENDGVCIGDF